MLFEDFIPRVPRSARVQTGKIAEVKQNFELYRHPSIFQRYFRQTNIVRLKNHKTTHFLRKKSKAKKIAFLLPSELVLRKISTLSFAQPRYGK